MLKTMTLLLITPLTLLLGSSVLADENPPADKAAHLITFSQSWLTVTYPENLKMESEFRGATNSFSLKNPANRDWLSIIYSPLSGMSYSKYLSARPGPDAKQKPNAEDHPVFPGATEIMSVVKHLKWSGYRRLIMPVGKNTCSRSMS